jgi:CheY-like chemotaxis protein
LGLSQIYGFIRQSGGIVQLETAPGTGTLVRLCLPLHALNPDSKVGAPYDNGRTVLLVEDEQDVREMTAEHLRDLGYRVLEAQDAAAALRLVQAGAHLDMLVSDVGLPGGMNGRQLADVVRERHPNLPIILITGYAAGQELSGMEVLSKPFDPATLVETVNARIEGAGWTRGSRG